MDCLLLNQMLSRRDSAQVAGLMRFFKCGPGQYGEVTGFRAARCPLQGLS